ncbi:D-alanyl-D-alanine carboxypeptidase [Candidatus Uhrbacteria bacterium]|nr:D-alanyl-D-alanine carboxypeptidase [Candidatus Uhrbacteria bacterium]
MIVKIVGQLLLATSVVHILPVDASSLAWQAGEAEAGEVRVAAATPWLATLPHAAARVVMPKKVDLDSYGIVTSAQTGIVVDAASGAVLYSERPDEVRAIGSITKLMTALVFLEQDPDLGKDVTLTFDDYVGGGRVYLRFDDEVALHDVLRASLIGSDNTATNALPRLVGMSYEDFIARMNAKAVELGMTATQFVDTSGVGAGNVSTARDLATLLAAAEANSTMAAILPRSAATITQDSGYSVTVESTNALLGSSFEATGYDVLVGKTGFIPQAGYCFATSVAHDGHTVRVVVLGAATKGERFSDAKGLAAWAFKTFSWE